MINRLKQNFFWFVFSIGGAFSFAVIALNRGESIGAIWIVIAAVCVYLIAYRFYSFIYRYSRIGAGCDAHDTGA